MQHANTVQKNISGHDYFCKLNNTPCIKLNGLTKFTQAKDYE